MLPLMVVLNSGLAPLPQELDGEACEARGVDAHVELRLAERRN